MSSSDQFQSYMRNLKKKHKESDEARIDVERSFHTCMSGFPEPLRYDLWYHFSDSYAPEGADIERLYELAVVLRRVIELFDEEYEISDDELSDSDWNAIKEIVDDMALELSTPLITYIMRWVIKRGLIS